MKKIIVGTAGIFLSMGILLLAGSSETKASMSYECWAYVGGSPDKMIRVVADNNSQAVRKAKDRMTHINIRYDYVKCK